MRKFRKFFFDDWVLITLNYHPVSIWSIFNASKTFIKSESHTPLNEKTKAVELLTELLEIQLLTFYHCQFIIRQLFVLFDNQSRFTFNYWVKLSFK
jgi:hypothetical protein